jgi:hypothetical protein
MNERQLVNTTSTAEVLVALRAGTLTRATTV